MKFSVVLSNYNGEKYLGEAIQSVLEQDYNDFEFIIVDDGSTDSSPEIIQRFANVFPQRILPVFAEVNQGQAAGFNRGVKVARGEIVAFIDSDDLWMPQKLSCLDKFISITGPAALYQHNLFFLKNGVRETEVYRPLLHTGDLYSETCKTRKIPAFVPTSGLAFPYATLEKVMPIPLAFRTCADGFLTRTTFCYGRVASACEAWGYYRVHEDNAVFRNQHHDGENYCDKILIPALNHFYESRGHKLRFPAMFTHKRINTPAPENSGEEKVGNASSGHCKTKADKLKSVLSSGSGRQDSVKAFFWRSINLSAHDLYRKIYRRIFS